MNLLAWNCRGLGLPRTVQELVQLIRTYRPKILFICETKLGDKKIKELRWRVGLRKCITQSGKGKGGGIALYYDEQLEIKTFQRTAILRCVNQGCFQWPSMAGHLCVWRT
jgi:exonuclease III